MIAFATGWAQFKRVGPYSSFRVLLPSFFSAGTGSLLGQSATENWADSFDPVSLVAFPLGRASGPFACLSDFVLPARSLIFIPRLQCLSLSARYSSWCVA
jgi:hypothetical protein